MPCLRRGYRLHARCHADLRADSVSYRGRRKQRPEIPSPEGRIFTPAAMTGGPGASGRSGIISRTPAAEPVARARLAPVRSFKTRRQTETMDLYQKIKTLPSNPGVYLYKNAEGEVIYVGKAKNLRARVRSYFVEGASDDAKTGSLLREAADIEYIVVGNEGEALALENNLIKQKQPRYNVLLRDDT